MKIQNGILIVGADRIILSHVSRWQVTQQAIVFHIHGHQFSLNMGAEAAKLDAELTAWFMNPLFMRAPLMHLGPIDLSPSGITPQPQ